MGYLEDEEDSDEGGFVPHVSFRQPGGLSRYVALCHHCGVKGLAHNDLDLAQRVQVLTRFLDDHRVCAPSFVSR